MEKFGTITKKRYGNKNFYDYTLDDFEFFDFDKLKPLSGKLELAI
jgi:hypothetical protein